MISMTIMNLETPTAGAKHELLFNKQATGCLLRWCLFNLNVYDTGFYRLYRLLCLWVLISNVKFDYFATMATHYSLFTKQLCLRFKLSTQTLLKFIS
jgi:hypothetical protein